MNKTMMSSFAAVDLAPLVLLEIASGNSVTLEQAVETKSLRSHELISLSELHVDKLSASPDPVFTSAARATWLTSCWWLTCDCSLGLGNNRLLNWPRLVVLTWCRSSVYVNVVLRSRCEVLRERSLVSFFLRRLNLMLILQERLVGLSSVRSLGTPFHL